MRQELSTREPHGARCTARPWGADARQGNGVRRRFCAGEKKASERPSSGRSAPDGLASESSLRNEARQALLVRVAASGNSESGAVASGGSRVRVGVSALERIASRFGAALDNARCTVSDSLLTSFSGPELGLWRSSAALHGADGKTTRVFRRALRATQASQRGAL